MQSISFIYQLTKIDEYMIIHNNNLSYYMGNQNNKPLEISEEDKKNLITCYNCNGIKAKYHGGCENISILGCILCRNYGDGYGQIYKKIRYVKLNFRVGLKKYNFTPPTYECLWCSDLKLSYRRCWDSEYFIEDKLYGWSDWGQQHMPIFDVPCFNCMPLEHMKAYDLKETEYFNMTLSERKQISHENLVKANVMVQPSTDVLKALGYDLINNPPLELAKMNPNKMIKCYNCKTDKFSECILCHNYGIHGFIYEAYSTIPITIKFVGKMHIFTPPQILLI